MSIKAHKPIKIEGVTVVPQWDWSQWYRKSYGMMMRGQPQDWLAGNEPSARTRLDGTAVHYARWLAGKHCIDLSAANHTEVEHGYVQIEGCKRDQLRARAVVFTYHRNNRAPSYWSGGCWRDDPHYSEPDFIARIEIPQWDLVAEATLLAA